MPFRRFANAIQDRPYGDLRRLDRVVDYADLAPDAAVGADAMPTRLKGGRTALTSPQEIVFVFVHGPRSGREVVLWPSRLDQRSDPVKPW